MYIWEAISSVKNNCCYTKDFLEKIFVYTISTVKRVRKTGRGDVRNCVPKFKDNFSFDLKKTTGKYSQQTFIGSFPLYDLDLKPISVVAVGKLPSFRNLVNLYIREGYKNLFFFLTH